MVACPGKERLVKVGARGRDAKDAGNFDAYKLQCRQLVDGSEGKRGRGLLEQIAAALQRVANGDVLPSDGALEARAPTGL